MKRVGRSTLEITTTIEINLAEAKILNLLTSYDLLKWFTEHCNERELGMSLKDAEKVLHDLRSTCSAIVTQHRIALEALNKIGRE